MRRNLCPHFWNASGATGHSQSKLSLTPQWKSDKYSPGVIIEVSRTDCETLQTTCCVVWRHQTRYRRLSVMTSQLCAGDRQKTVTSATAARSRWENTCPTSTSVGCTADHCRRPTDKSRRSVTVQLCQSPTTQSRECPATVYSAYHRPRPTPETARRGLDRDLRLED